MRWKLLGWNLKQDVGGGGREKELQKMGGGREGGREAAEAGTDKKKKKITHLEQSLLNYSTHILPPLGYVGVELVQIGGER